MTTQDSSSALRLLHKRSADSHKGDYGRVVLLGGSRGMTGAISMAGMAALRSGSGLVTLGVPEVCLDVVAGFAPAYMTHPLSCDSQGRLTVAAREQIASLVNGADCVAVGPGIGRSAQLTALVAWMFQVLPGPMVVDADALYALAQRSEPLEDPGGPRVVTPHPGEFARLLGEETSDRDKMEMRAGQLAALHRVVVVLKGHRTLVTDGRQSSHNSTGNPGMATAGSGDVLTGVITALIGQGLEPFDAARLGVYVHGLAGDLAAARLGQVSMISSDLLDSLPQAFQQIES